MKKILLLSVSMFLAVALFGQSLTFKLSKEQERALMKNKVFPVLYKSSSPKATYFIDENFDSGIPSDWTITDGGNDGYTWQGVNDYSGNTLDGTPFAFVDSDGAGSVDMDEILESPEVDVSSANVLLLSFDQYYNSYSGNEITDVDVWDGTQWVNVYTAGSDDIGAWGNPDHQMIDVTAYKNANFKVRFHYYNANYDWYWAIDNVKVYALNNDDLSVVSATPDWVEVGNDVTPVVVVRNEGINDQNAFSVTYKILDTANNELFSTSVDITGVTLASLTDTAVVMPDTWTNAPEGVYNVVAYVTLTGDEDSSNDTLTATLEVVKFSYTHNIIYTNVLYDGIGNGWDDKTGYFDTTGTFTPIGSISSIDMISGIDFVGPTGSEKLYGVDLSGNLYIINGTTGKAYLLTNLGVNDITGLAWNSVDSNIYLLTWTGELYSYSIDTKTLQDLGSTNMQYAIGLAIDTAQTFYALSLDDNLYSFTLSNITATLIGGVGFNLNYLQDIGIDLRTNTLYGALFNGDTYDGGLFIIDKQTGAATAAGQVYNPVEFGMCAVRTVPTYAVTFHVADTAGNPLENAQIAVAGNTLTTDTNGVATANFENGDYTAITTLTGYYPDTTAFTVADSAITVNIALVQMSFDITFAVKDTAGNPIEGATITVNQAAKGDTITTDTNGYATITLSFGDYEAVVAKDGYVADTLNFTANNNDTIEVALVPEATIIKGLDNISVYPNPTSGQLNVALDGDYNLTLSDIQGKVLMRKQFNGNSVVDLSGLQNGIYFIRVENEKGYAVYKIIKR